jgi:phage gp46-like protein
MSDLKIIWDDDLSLGDIEFKNEDFINEFGLETAVILSLFLDRRADDDDELDDINDKRGWWGDELEENDDKIGSKLWQLDRSKTTQDTINSAKEFVEESLQWMIDDKVAADIKVEISRGGSQETPILIISVEIYKNDGNIEVYEFDDLWKAQLGG